MWITFSASVAESADSTSGSMLACDELGVLLAPSAWWRGKPSAAQSWATRCKRSGWTNVLSGAAISPTCQPPTFPVSTGTSAAIPASPFPPLVQREGRTIGDICGPSSSDSSTLFDLAECFSRTWPDTSHSVFVMCSETWRDLASDVRLACIQRRKSEHLTDATGSSSLAWPTATSADSRETANRTANRKKLGGHSGTTLVDAVRMWPTPSASEDAAGSVSGKMQPMLGNHPDIRGPLDQESSPTDGSRHVLSPLFVEALMGFPIGWTDCEPSETQSCPSKPSTPSSDSGAC